MRAAVLIGAGWLSVAASVPGSLHAQAINPEALYKDTCAQCHDQPQGRTPSRAALRDRSPEAILLAVTSGSMSMQAITLSIAEKRALAEHLAGKPLSTPSASPSAGSSACATKDTSLAAYGSRPAWNGFGVDATNSRFQPRPGLTAADVPKLKLKWAFGFPGGSQAYGNPAIVAGRVFVGSDTGVFYSIDGETGCTQWTFQADAGIRSAPTVAPSGSGRAARHVVYFGDLKANIYAVDAATGQQIWKKSADPHRFARITGSVAFHDGRLYVPVSSIEEGPGAQQNYECCTFRGSVVALEAESGNQIWKTYTIAETPVQVGKNSAGTPLWAPAGAAVWNAPTIDVQRGRLYIGTGNSYTGPAVKTSDSVIAMDLKTGKILWWNQVTPSDAFLVGCRPGVENCPKDVGPDYDFGNSPILRTLSTSSGSGNKRVIVIGQKSGILWGLDPDNEGKVLWQYRAGKGSALGGIEWGSAADDVNAYVPVSDVLAPPNEAGGLHAVKLATGERVWHTPAPKLDCTQGRGCTGAQSAPASVIPGVVFSGSVDGHLRAYSTTDGAILWDFNTAQPFDTVNHVPAKGGSIDAAGPAIADGLVVTNSGYSLWRGLPGNVLLAFSK
ncbi:MAG TPA: PQQ-binding-like beta-propeller repeat protein [Vicinamibacterales bacterium]|jgi:polyvinyl alcohol dehydrogenase (cytochrome)|nr:PQQ-binding-like beta-propeller repeat protein [Vicinamibacterales bacterium]